MKALQITKINESRIITTDRPEPNPNEVLIQVMASGICGTDIHILEADWNYQGYNFQRGSVLHHTDGHWDFELMTNGNLMAIDKHGARHGTRTDLHIMKTWDAFQSFDLQTPTGLSETDGNWEFEVMADGDLMGIKKSLTGTGRTEVHILNA